MVLRCWLGLNRGTVEGKNGAASFQMSPETPKFTSPRRKAEAMTHVQNAAIFLG